MSLFCDLNQLFFGQQKRRSSAAACKCYFWGSGKIALKRRPEKAIFLRVEMSLFIGSQKQ